LLVAPRSSDGSLPINDFLRLKSTSDLINKGMNLGFAFSGSAPDLGAFEFQDPNAVQPKNTNNIGQEIQAITDPSRKGLWELKFSLLKPTVASIKILDYLGRIVFRSKPTVLESGIHTEVINLASLKKGIYIACVETDKSIRSIRLGI